MTGSRRRIASGVALAQLDEELAVESLGDPEQRVDPRWPAAALEPGDRRLRRAGQLRELALREAASVPLLGDLVGDLGEEPAAVADALDPLDRLLAQAL